jgi:electron transfer flavoprotein alpha subunit
MKALVIGNKTSHLVDGLGFIQALSSETGVSIEAYGLLYGGGAEETKGFTKIFSMPEASPEAVANTVSKLIEKMTLEMVIAPAEKNGTEILSRVASVYDMPMITEVSGISKAGENTYLERAIMGGRATALYRFKTPMAVTVPAKKFKASESGATPEFEELQVIDGVTKVVEVLPKEKGAVDLEAADVIVGVGRGFKAKDDLAMAFELAELLDGEVGCSRPVAADFKWLGEDRWIGISGKKIRGKLYIAVGISGAPQHIMAASDTKVIVAVNKDKNAPIFTFSDYGVVADLYQFLPVFIKKLKEKKGV